MAHFAKLDENNIVVGVYVVGDEYEETYAESRLEFGEVYVQTSYNNNIRKQYAGIGFSYNAVNDVFIAPQPYPSWSLDADYNWQPPTPMPTEGIWYWNEAEQAWVDANKL